MEKIVLPEIGDDIKSGVIIAIQKKAGEEINEGDIIIEVETDKAAFPVNSPFSGTIKNILIKEGDEVEIGGVIAEVETGESGDGGSSKEKTESVKESPAQAEAQPVEVEEKSKEAVKEASDTAAAVESKNELKQTAPPPPPPPPPPPSPTPIALSSNTNFHASPATRKLARELGVDLSFIRGTERGGRISLDDLKKFVKGEMSKPNQSGGPVKSNPLPDFSAFGEVEEKPASNLRKTISDHISYSYATIPHVHQFGEVDLTKIDLYQKEYKTDFKEKESSLSVTVFIIKALAVALKKFPDFNSSYDPAKNIIYYKKYFNIGVAVDTPNGLIVPVIKEVDKLSLFEIGKQLITIAKATRDRTVAFSDLKGASTTVSNLGGIGGTYFNPIVNWPEVCILGVGRSKIEPRYENGAWVPHHIMPIVLGYDHRVIDGADGARFITYLKNILERPEKILMGVES